MSEAWAKNVPLWKSIHGWYQHPQVFKSTAPDDLDEKEAAELDYCTYKAKWRGMSSIKAQQAYDKYTDITQHRTFGGVMLSDPKLNKKQCPSAPLNDSKVSKSDRKHQNAYINSHFVWAHVSHIKVYPHTLDRMNKGELSTHEISLSCLTMHPLKVLCDNFKVRASNMGVNLDRRNAERVDDVDQLVCCPGAPSETIWTAPHHAACNRRLIDLLGTTFAHTWRARNAALMEQYLQNWYSNAANPKDEDVSYTFFSTKQELLEFMQNRLGPKHKSCSILNLWLEKDNEYRKEATSMGLHCPANIAWFPLDTTYANGADRLETVKQFTQALQPAHSCTCERCMQFNHEPGVYNESEHCYEQAIRSCPGSHFVPVEIIECGIQIEPMTYNDPVIQTNDTELGVKLVMNVIPVLCPVAKAMGCQGSDFTSNAVQVLHCLHRKRPTAYF